MILQETVPSLKTFLNVISLPKTSADHLCRLVVGFMFHFGRMSATAAASALTLLARHRAQIGRWLAESGLGDCGESYLKLAGAVALEIRCGPGRIFIVVDKTCVSRRGAKTPNAYSTGNRKRRPRKGRRYSKYAQARRNCHAFVCGLVLYPDGTRIPYVLSYYTRQFCAANHRQHLTESDLGAELVRRIPVPSRHEVLVLGDTSYESRALRNACAERKFYFMTPVNPERVLEGKVPRKKVSSILQKLSVDDLSPIRFHPHRGPFARQRRVSRSRCGPKTKSQTFYVYEERVRVHSVGEVRVLFSTKRKPQRRSNQLNRRHFKILMTNHPTASCQECVEMYDLRWQIELFFKELKSGLGITGYRFRDFAAVAAWFECGLITFLYLEWYRLRQMKSRRLPKRQKQWWARQRTVGIMRYVRLSTEQAQLTTIQRWCKTKSGLRRLRKAMRHARPLEDRIPTILA